VPKDHEEGFILLPALLLAGMIAVALSAFLVHIKIEVKAGGNLVANAIAETLADGIVQLVAFDLAQAPDKKPLARGTVSRCAVDSDHTALVRVQDQGGLVDLNAASPATLAVLLALAGLPPEEARIYADRIADFRDTDESPRPNGAEAEEYRAAGLEVRPKNGPFLDVAELDQIIGMTEDLRRSLSPLITVHSHQAGRDISAAPGALRDAAAESLPSSRSQQQSFGIDVVVNSPSGAFGRRAVIQILGRAERPFVINEWKRVSADEAAQLQSQPADSCPYATHLLNGSATR
jgi:general secretion pathway protein K